MTVLILRSQGLTVTGYIDQATMVRLLAVR